MLGGGGVDAVTLVAALGAGPPPPECRWGRRPHRGAMACRLLERDDRGVFTHSQTVHIQRGHEHTRRGNGSRGGLVERARIRRHCGPLCSKLIAAVSGSIYVAVVSVVGGVFTFTRGRSTWAGGDTYRILDSRAGRGIPKMPVD